MLCSGRFKRVTLSSMVPRYIKFALDVMFAKIAHKLYKSDIFITKELMDIVHSISIKADELSLGNIRH